LEYKEGRGQKSGPWIELPVPENEDVKKYLVTNTRPKNKKILEAFDRPSWKIITKIKDWPTRQEEEGLQGAKPASNEPEQTAPDMFPQDPVKDSE
jgi:hypothetical protein